MTVLLFEAEKRCRFAIAKPPAGISDIRRPDDVVDQVPAAVLEADQSGIRKSVRGFPPVSRSNLKEPITFMIWVAPTQIIVILCEHRPTIHHLGLVAQPGLRKIDRAAAGTLRLHLHEGPVGRGAHRRDDEFDRATHLRLDRRADRVEDRGTFGITLGGLTEGLRQ